MSAIMSQSARPLPRHFGAVANGSGVDVQVWSETATAVELCIFDNDGTRELRRVAMTTDGCGVWRVTVAGAGPGMVYGLRVDGPYDAASGFRYNREKVLLDPYAREIVGKIQWDTPVFGYVQGHPSGSRSRDTQNNELWALKARVPSQRSEGPFPVACALRRNAAEIVLYELHVRGFSKLNPEVPEHLRGTYAGLAHAASIRYLRQLGVTTLTVMPVQQSLAEFFLAAQGRVNYWGYNTIGFFAPDPRFASCGPDPAEVNAEFREMVTRLHEAGLEVVLDIVLNHTAEGDELGPTLSFRGLDNMSWYRVVHDDRARYENYSGCGNTLNTQHPRVVQFVLDVLRYWVVEMGVDGFRFDLATVLGRGRDSFDPGSALLVAMLQDPVLRDVRLIAEPWDCGAGGYQLGRFPGHFSEWNDHFRDSVRRYWLGLGTSRGEFARRFLGSSDYFQRGNRRPWASVNFVAAHDGFTLRDVVSYARKHNEANGEHNRDGRDGEPSWNFGVEGETSDQSILTQRLRVRNAMIATTLLAQGTPMLLAGDERGNTQSGNNNAYCIDNELSWVDWGNRRYDAYALVSAILELRAREPLLQHPNWFADGPADIPWARWFGPSGTLSVADWHDADQRVLAVELGSGGSPRGRVRILFNPEAHAVSFALDCFGWSLVVDTRVQPDAAEPGFPCPTDSASELIVPAHCVLVYLSDES